MALELPPLNINAKEKKPLELHLNGQKCPQSWTSSFKLPGASSKKSKMDFFENLKVRFASEISGIKIMESELILIHTQPPT